mmetsp:Transcript_5241/g.10224  ORF Transcript_5241/g.10224 Transcript_5241/m.10224 type:complete len:88 (-) Transcript_5241:30-293(-)
MLKVEAYHENLARSLDVTENSTRVECSDRSTRVRKVSYTHRPTTNMMPGYETLTHNKTKHTASSTPALERMTILRSIVLGSTLDLWC